MDVKKIIIVCLLCALTVLSGHIISVRKTISVLEKSVDEIGNQYKRYIVSQFVMNYCSINICFQIMSEMFSLWGIPQISLLHMCRAMFVVHAFPVF